jgi:hypothetical protein
MKEFLLLFRGADKERAAMSPEEKEAHMNRWTEWVGAIAAQGKYNGGHPLRNDSGKVISGRAKQLSDGPFIEGKEIIGGYILVKAATEEEALAIAMECPNLEGDTGTVEIREISSNSPHA